MVAQLLRRRREEGIAHGRTFAAKDALVRCRGEAFALVLARREAVLQKR